MVRWAGRSIRGEVDRSRYYRIISRDGLPAEGHWYPGTPRPSLTSISIHSTSRWVLQRERGDGAGGGQVLWGFREKA